MIGHRQRLRPVRDVNARERIDPAYGHPRPGDLGVLLLLVVDTLGWGLGLL